MTDTDDSAGRAEAIRQFYRDAQQVSDWFDVTQDIVNEYCRATGDNDWIHTDPVRARRDGPYGGTIAPGFWTVSMLTHLSRNATGADCPAGAVLAINYGFDRVRFPGPVRVGARIRIKFKLLEVAPREGGRFLVRTESTIEVEGQEKPGLVAEWMILLVYPA
jgi:acyl dehydratase